MDKFTASLFLAIVRTYTTRLRLLSSYLGDTTLARDMAGARHLLKPMSQRMKQVFAGWALEAVLAAALRPPSNEDSLADRLSLGGLRRSFVTRPAWSFIGVSPETSIGRIVWLLLSTEAPIYGLDKPVGRPRTRRGTGQAVVVHGRPGRLHLLQRHAASKHVLNRVANERD